MGFDFDAGNFGLGVLAGWATGYAVYRARDRIGAARKSLSQQADSAQELASSRADRRYVGDLIEFCQTSHLAGATINLSEILVEPQFIPAPELLQPLDEDADRTVFHVVPTVPDFPYLQAPYNVPGLTINELDNGDSAIALLGLPGSGRTTALQAIALWALGEVRFDPSADVIEHRLESEEAASKKDDALAKKVRERRQMEDIALDTLARQRGVDANALFRDGLRTGGTRLKQLAPVYAHFGNLNVDRREFGRKIDPAEPLLRAVQQHTGGITRRTLAPGFYSRLSEGKILLLLDGFDEVPAADQPRLLNWLDAYLEHYSQNFTIVTGPARGYGGLLRAGLAPVFLRPWNDVDTSTHANLWAEHWAQISGKRRRQAELFEDTMTLAHTGNRAQTPFDLAAKLWATYDAQDKTDYDTRMDHLIRAFLAKGDPDRLMQQLIAAAQLQLDAGYITAAGLEAALTGMPIPSAPAAAPIGEDDDDFSAFDLADEDAGEDYGDLFAEDGDEDDDFAADLDGADSEEDYGDLFGDEDDDEFGDDLDAVFDEDAPVELSGDDTLDDTPEVDETASSSTKEYQKIIQQFQDGGLLTAYRNGRYQFRHPLMAAYLASQVFKGAEETVLLDKALDPNWQDALAFAATHTPVDTVVEARMQAPLDVLQNTLLDTARWLGHCAGKPQWRAGVLRELGNMFVASNQYLVTRERVAAALISSRDRNALVVFAKSLRHPNPDVRRLACLGVGALQDVNSVDALTARLGDSDTDVQLAAGLALGAIGNEAALDEMWVTMTESTEELRQAVAETLAGMPDEGYPILYDAANGEDYMLRRAAVYGLRRIDKLWALMTVYRLSIEDDQWYVRSAAEAIFEAMKTGDAGQGVQHYPAVETIPWLRDWVMRMGLAGGIDTRGDSSVLLRRALEQGGPEIQLLSAINIGQMGFAAHTGVLYALLRNREPQVREAAFRALGDIQLHVGQSLPAPI